MQGTILKLLIGVLFAYMPTMLLAASCPLNQPSCYVVAGVDSQGHEAQLKQEQCDLCGQGIRYQASLNGVSFALAGTGSSLGSGFDPTQFIARPGDSLVLGVTNYIAGGYFCGGQNYSSNFTIGIFDACSGQLLASQLFSASYKGTSGNSNCPTSYYYDHTNFGGGIFGDVVTGDGASYGSPYPLTFVVPQNPYSCSSCLQFPQFNVNLQVTQ